MPCYLRGRTVIRDIDRLNQIANTMGLNIQERDKYYVVYHKNKLIGEFLKSGQWNLQQEGITDIFREYNKSQIKMAAQKKGWKVSNINLEEDKIVIRLRE